MLIVCPNCVSSYRVNPDILRLSQGVVRCAQCRRSWSLAEDGHEAWAFDGERPVPQSEASAGKLTAGARALDAQPHAAKPPRARRVADTEQSSPVRAVAAVLLLLALMTGAIGWRRPIVHAAPALAPIYALVGLQANESSLTLQDVKTAMVREGTTPVLTLEGTIENGRKTVARVPNIRIVVRDQAEQSVYTWTAAAPKTSLAPGETVTFKSRLVAPPGNGHDLEVGFADAHAVLSEAMVKGTR